MSGYLKKYIGTYRVLADIDLATNDFVRIKSGKDKGKLDPSFDDFYIPCKSSSKIRHYQSNILLFYCPTKGRFRNILKQIYTDKIGTIEKFQIVKISKDNKELTSFDTEAMYKELIDNNILLFTEELDDECEFRFKSNQMEYIAELVGAKTSGAKISPFSTKNLPSKKISLKKYNIPLEELTLYKEIIKVLNNKERLVISKLQEQFNSIIQAEKGALYDINAERKLSCLGGKEFIHSIGLFDKYLDFLKVGIVKYQSEKKMC